MTETDLADVMGELLNGGALEDFSDDRFTTRTFEEAGVLTSNKGLVVYVDGEDTQFQVTIVRSR